MPRAEVQDGCHRLASVQQRLVDRNPQTSAADLLKGFVPPPKFATVSFDTYIPDPNQPTQAAAVAAMRAFATSGSSGEKRRWFKKSAPPESRAGIYLDGGFGVGKTHLLASLWHEATGPKAFGTFVGYTNLVGALGFAQMVSALSAFRLVCIDEFELDDPGDTVLMSTLLNKLVDQGVRLAATSNTLPDRLGEGRFAADDFVREIQGLAAHFDIIRIDGDDYRHRGLPDAPPPRTTQEVERIGLGLMGATLDSFADIERHLMKVHPSRYGHMLDGVTAVCITDVTTLTDQAQALRTVVLADRLYDRDVPVVTSGVPLDSLFSEEMMRGGYRKKYFRAVSRLVALARNSDAIQVP